MQLLIKPVNLTGNQPWIFIGRTDTEAPILWPPDAKRWLTGKDPDAGKDWRQEEKGATEDEMVGWYHQLNGHESKQTMGDSGGQGSLACYNPWGFAKGWTWLSDSTTWLLKKKNILLPDRSEQWTTLNYRLIHRTHPGGYMGKADGQCEEEWPCEGGGCWENVYQNYVELFLRAHTPYLPAA